MTAFFAYLIQVNVAVALFYGFYRLLFREDTFLRGRRAALLGLIVAAVGYPFIEVTWRLADNRELLEGILSGIAPVYTLPEVVVVGGSTAASVSWTDRWPELLFGLYGLAAAGLLVRILIQMGIIAGFVIRSQVIESHGIIVRQCQGMKTPFSFFRWIVLDTTLYTDTELQEILRHEETHVREGHSFDILLAELLCTFCWFNPFSWLLKQEIQLNLEFLADRSVLASGYEAEHYQFHLLRLTYHKAAAKIVNNFNVSLLKKRIFMMNKKQTSKLSIVKYTLLIPVIGMLVFFNSAFQMQAGNVATSDSNLPVEAVAAIEISDAPVMDLQAPKPPPIKETVKIGDAPAQAPKAKLVIRRDDPSRNDTVFDQVEEMPRFPGGEKALLKFLQDNMKYPVSAQEATIQGRVILRFVVGTDGSITEVSVQRSLDPACDQEAVRVVKSMPKWTPGKLNGKPVAVFYTLPVNFKLSGGKKELPPPPPPLLKEGVYQIGDVQIAISKVPKKGEAVEEDPVIEVNGVVVSMAELRALDQETVQTITVNKSTKPNRIIVTLKQ